jgi:hypothetical protein
MKPKIIFWLNADITIFSIANVIQKKYDADFFAIIDVPNKPKKFFQQQHLVKFAKIWFYHDHIKPNLLPDLQYLQTFEKKYGINLWTLASNERILYEYNEFYSFSNNEVLSILEQECKLFENVINEVKPDFVIMFNTNLHHEDLFYTVCKKNSVLPMLLVDTRLANRYAISSVPDNVDFFPKLLDGKSDLKTFDQLIAMRKSFDMQKMVIHAESRFIKSKTQMMKALLKFIFNYDNSNRKTHYTYYGRTKSKVVVKSTINYLKQLYRKRFINRKFIHKVEDQNFIFFALQTYPERTILLTAPFYTTGLDFIINNVAKSLPVEYTLYVKEHPAQQSRDWRSTSFYRKLMSIPNVKMVHPSANSQDFIQKSDLVISISSTSCFEAAFYGKPSILFADTNFSFLSNVLRVKSFEDLPNAIKDCLKKKVNPQEIGEYLEITLKNTFDFNFYDYTYDFSDRFQYGSFFLDADFPEAEIALFLENKKEIADRLAHEFIKKINELYTKN